MKSKSIGFDFQRSVEELRNRRLKLILKAIAIAAQAEHDQGLAEANAGNARALNTLTTEHGVQAG